MASLTARREDKSVNAKAVRKIARTLQYLISRIKDSNAVLHFEILKNQTFTRSISIVK